MLTCKEFLTELSDFLDENVDQELRRHLEAHVNECPNCFVILDTTRRTIRVYQGMDAKTIPDDVHSRLMQALDKKIASCNKSNPTPEA